MGAEKCWFSLLGGIGTCLCLPLRSVRSKFRCKFLNISGELLVINREYI